MEVIRNSDIARLVLGYLQDNNLNNAAYAFLSTSPYLKEDFELHKKGFRLMNVGCDPLVDIVKEHCEIKLSVDQLIDVLPQNIREDAISRRALSSRTSFILENVVRPLITSEEYSSSGGLKRRRSINLTDKFEVETTRVEDLPGYRAPLSKKRRLSSSYLVLNRSVNITASDVKRSELNSEHESKATKKRKLSIGNSSADENSTQIVNLAPTIPVISETLLSKPQFHTKLAENINRALQTSVDIPSTNIISISEDNMNKQFEDAIENILYATEQDPGFDKIIEEVIYSAMTTSSKIVNKVDKSTQCSLKSNELEISENSTISQMTIVPGSPEHFDIGSIMPKSIATKSESTKEMGSNVATQFSFEESIINMSDIVLVDDKNLEIQLPKLARSSDFGTTNEEVILGFNGDMTIPFSLTNCTTVPLLVTEDVLKNEQIANTIVKSNNICVSLPETISSTITNLPKPHKTVKEEGIQARSTRANFQMCTDNRTPAFDKCITKPIRSLSTPRRKTSHVRVLNFSSPVNHYTENIPMTENSENNFSKDEVKGSQESSTELIVTKIPQEKSPISSGSSNSNVPDFAKYRNDETVIHKNITETPQRRTEKNNCVRKLSQSNSAENNVKNKVSSNEKQYQKEESRSTNKKSRKTPHKEKEQPKDEQIEDELDAMREWQKMRSSVTIKNVDNHLRELVSKSQTFQYPTRRKRRPNKFKTNNTILKSAPKKKQSKSNFIGTEKLNHKINQDLHPNLDINNCCGLSMNKSHSTMLSIKTDTDKQQDNLTAIQNKTVTKPKQENISPIVVNVDENCKKQSQIWQELDHKMMKRNGSEKLITTEVKPNEIFIQTPFKNIDDQILPFTPRFIVPGTLDTPITKLLNSNTELSIIKNIDIPTPSFAITPGSLTAEETKTPRNAYLNSTDYSSSGSYYKPDESDNLDKHFDQLAKLESKKKKAKELLQMGSAFLPEKSSVLGIEVQLKTVTVPAVLDRAKSFSETAPSVIPHYTFAEGLPHKTNAVTSSEIPESSSDSSSSSSSASNSTSDSSSNFFSDIDSSEDEDWKHSGCQQNASTANENSLISEDGEIRYPMRNWITLNKVNPSSPHKSRQVGNQFASSVMSIKVVDKVGKRLSKSESKGLSDLESKRLRMIGKLKNDFPGMKSRGKLGKDRSVIGKRVNKISKTKDFIVAQKFDQINVQEIKDTEKTNELTDVLKALNLSKKKTKLSTEREETAACLLARTRTSTQNTTIPKTCEQNNLNQSEKPKKIFNKKGATNIELCSIKEKPSKRKSRTTKAKNPSSSAIGVFRMCLRSSIQTENKKGVKNTRRNVKSPKKVVNLKKLPAVSKKSVILPELKDNPVTHSKSKVFEKSVSPQRDCGNDAFSSNYILPSAEEEIEEVENEDPYDQCRMIFAKEIVKANFRAITYSSSRAAPTPETIVGNLSMKTMNIFIDGKRHVLTVTKEFELYPLTTAIQCKTDKQKYIRNIPKKRERKEHIESPLKKDVPTNSVSLLNATDLKSWDEHVVNVVQANLVNAARDRGGSREEENASAQSSGNHAEIKAEDINAVLSHLYGDEGS